MPTRRTAKKPARRRTRNPSGAITPALIAKIARLTDQNDHTGSILALAEALKQRENVKALEAVEVLHKRFGYMPAGLRAVRDELSASVMAGAKRDTDAATYQRLYRAF